MEKSRHFSPFVLAAGTSVALSPSDEATSGECRDCDIVHYRRNGGWRGLADPSPQARA